MICILDIDSEHSNELKEFLIQIDDRIKISSNESEILNSSKIIISFSNNIQKALKKIHLLNLYSALKMIASKPVLGINSGMHLMCETIEKYSCLGLIPATVNKKDTLKDLELNENFSSIIKIKDDELLVGIDEDAEFYFEQHHFITQNQFTTSLMKKNPNVSATLKKNNFYGIQFIPQKSGINGLKVLKNFLDI
jgi:glutamine amidotransferase